MPSFQNPKGTRDFFPDQLLRRRFILEAWRRTALIHGFDEIDGPTFEHLDLYTVKSGEGIVSELFSFTRAGGDDVYALRPEFTPTLARMYAAHARELPSPTRWFCTPNFFRAERPQRGRLREFFQWNVDVLGDDQPLADAEVIACAADLFRRLGLTPENLRIRISNRTLVTDLIARLGVVESNTDAVLALLDRRAKMKPDEFHAAAAALDLNPDALESGLDELAVTLRNAFENPHDAEPGDDAAGDVIRLARELDALDALKWCEIDLSIVRGLAYYTGTVFEAVVQGERAVAGGGRYDGLVKLFGGPETPAIGFGMGDVVLANVLDDLGLMPQGPALLDALSQPMPTRPDAFVIPGGDDDAERAFPRVVADLRRHGLHARRTYKTTRKIGKLLKDADACAARFAIIVENATHATIKNLADGEQRENVPLDSLADAITAA